MQIQSKVVDKQDDSFTADAENLKEELKNIENYDELRERIKEIVSQKVVDDVANVITKSNDAPVFSDLDDKLAERKTSKPETDDGDEDITKESVIFRMTGKFVAESALAGNRMTTEEGMNHAFVEYAMCHVDYLFKLDPGMFHLCAY